MARISKAKRASTERRPVNVLRVILLILRLLLLPPTFVFTCLLYLWSVPFRIAEMVRLARNPFVCADALTRFVDEKDPSVRLWDLYCCFRWSSLSRTDSFFNAYYTWLCHRAYHGRARRAPRGVPRHPFGWYGGDHARLPRRLTLLYFKIVTALPRIFSFPARLVVSAKKISRAMDSSHSAIGAVSRFLRKRGKVLLPLVLCLVVGIAIGFYARMEVTLAVRVGGETVGYVESRKELLDAVREAENSISTALGTTYKLPENVSFFVTKKINPKYLSKAELVERLKESAKEYTRFGYGLFVEGELVAASTDERVLNQVLLDAEAFAREKSEDESIRLLTDARVLPQDCPLEAYLSEEELSALLSSESEEGGGVIFRLSAYTPKTLPLAKKLSEGEAYSYTLNYAEALLEKKGEVSLVYGFVKNEEVEEAENFSVSYRVSDKIYEGTQYVEQKGVLGKKKTTYSVEYCGDVEYSRTAVSEQILEESVEQIVLIGTKPLPAVGEGGEKKIFLYPVYPEKGISSYYGGRDLNGESEFHTAVDIPGTDTTPLYAAAGGVVLEAGDTETSYGIAVKIQHENGMCTYYSHLSAVKVRVGQYVTRNQMIGNVGTTGRVTGPHVHFEVRNENNYPVNPMPYLLEY